MALKWRKTTKNLGKKIGVFGVETLETIYFEAFAAFMHCERQSLISPFKSKAPYRKSTIYRYSTQNITCKFTKTQLETNCNVKLTFEENGQLQVPNIV